MLLFIETSISNVTFSFQSASPKIVSAAMLQKFSVKKKKLSLDITLSFPAGINYVGTFFLFFIFLQTCTKNNDRQSTAEKHNLHGYTIDVKLPPVCRMWYFPTFDFERRLSSLNTWLCCLDHRQQAQQLLLCLNRHFIKHNCEL